ncbi:class I SAM-dependent methyltransferase [Candidatus Sumerlaeota bacterium]|nr:class I SAM-dependent methyltransferase [Candidatus Sumerlaeota bacterium]
MEPEEYQSMFELEDRHWWFQGRLALVRRILSRYAPVEAEPRARLLDIGCGTGMFLQRAGIQRTAFGLDLSRQALRFTRSRGVERLVCADSQAIPFRPDSFDIVTAFDVIEHVEADRIFVGGVREILRPGGIFLATVPAHPYLWSGHDEALHHKRRYRWNQFDSLFGDGDWIKRRMTYTFAGIYPIAAVVRSARRLLPHRGNPAADTQLTGGSVNGLLLAWHRLEAVWTERFDLPFGLSIMTVREKRPRRSDS